MASTDFYLRGLEYLEQFQKEPYSWLKEIKRVGIARKVPIIDDDMGRFLKMLCALNKPASILEIGCGISYATHWMLLGHPNARITGLDYNQDRLDICADFLKTSGFSGNVTLKRTWAKDFFQTQTSTFDLIFQDSTKKEYAGMLENCYQSLKPGGLLIVDNIFYNGKVMGLADDQEKKYRKAVEALELFNQQISNHEGFDCHFFAISDGVLVAQRKS